MSGKKLSGLLRGAYERPTTAQCSVFEEWNGKRVPGKITLTYSGKPVLSSSWRRSRRQDLARSSQHAENS
jgi:hypothetical protein